MLYNLLYFQVVMQLSCNMTEQERVQWRASDAAEVENHGSVMSLEGIMALIIGLLEQTHLYQLEDTNHRVHDTGASVAANLQASRKRVEMEVCIYIYICFHFINPLNPELNPICYFLALLGAHHFLHVSRIRVKLLTFRLLMSYIYRVFHDFRA